MHPQPAPLPPGFQLHPENPQFMWNPTTNEVRPVPGPGAPAAPAGYGPGPDSPAGSWGAPQAQGQPQWGGSATPDPQWGSPHAQPQPQWGAAPPPGNPWHPGPAGHAAHHDNTAVDPTSWLGMSLTDSVGSALRKYATFSGRASRSEYWYFFLFNILVGVAAIALDNVIFGPLNGGSGPIDLLTTLALFLPGLAVYVRRLHDAGRSGWWMFIALTIVGIIPLLIWLCSEGSREINEFGLPVAEGPPGR